MAFSNDFSARTEDEGFRRPRGILEPGATRGAIFGAHGGGDAMFSAIAEFIADLIDGIRHVIRSVRRP